MPLISTMVTLSPWTVRCSDFGSALPNCPAHRFTFGSIFDIDLSDPAIRNRHKKMHVEAVLRYLEPRRKS